jgi:hypothetical protein
MVTSFRGGLYNHWRRNRTPFFFNILIKIFLEIYRIWGAFFEFILFDLKGDLLGQRSIMLSMPLTLLRF